MAIFLETERYKPISTASRSHWVGGWIYSFDVSEYQKR